MEAYDYLTPDGFGDTYFVYAFDVDNAGGMGANITPGANALRQRIGINDGEFRARWWRGVDQYGNASQGIQIRDRLQNQYFSDTLVLNPTSGSLMNPTMNTGFPIMPEVAYPDSGYIGLDFYGALPGATNQPGQIAFHGVRRRKGIKSDPVPSPYKYYEKPYQYQVTATIPAGYSITSAGVLIQIPITDFDFECRRIDGYGAANASLTYSCPG
jgi:hypothetical protein